VNYSGEFAFRVLTSSLHHSIPFQFMS